MEKVAKYKLSIVLTVYNKEMFIRRALDSLLMQDGAEGENYEILAVNDGSTDASTDILKEYEQKYDNVHILAQENQGLSMARNNGVDASKGEYVWFVDADDIIANDAVRLISEAIESQADVLPIYARTDGIDKVRNGIAPDAKTGKEVILGREWQYCGVFYIFKKAFLKDNKLRFFPGIYHEDSEFTPRMLYLAQTVHVIPKVLYTVYRDPNGITQVPRVKRAYDYLTVVDSLAKYFGERKNLEKEVSKVMCYEMSVIINNAFYVVCKNSKKNQKEFNEFFFEKRNTLLRPLIIAPLFKYRVESVLFRMFPRHYVEVYKTMKLFG